MIDPAGFTAISLETIAKNHAEIRAFYEAALAKNGKDKWRAIDDRGAAHGV